MRMVAPGLSNDHSHPRTLFLYCALSSRCARFRTMLRWFQTSATGASTDPFLAEGQGTPGAGDPPRAAAAHDIARPSRTTFRHGPATPTARELTRPCRTP